MLKKFAVAFCLVLIAGIFITCDFDTPITGYFEYYFSNQTNQTVTIELDQAYRVKEYPAVTKEEIDNLQVYISPLNISSKGSTVVYISKKSVDFQWEAANRNDNLEVYCETNGSSAIFMVREIGGYYNYEFKNGTMYIITVSMSQPYKTYKNGTESSKALDINPGINTTVYVLKDSLDFQWTASNANNSAKIYSEVNGAKVLFMER